MKDWEGSTVALNGTEVTVSLPNGVNSEEGQISKYHGFYVARYEAGYEKAENETDKTQGDDAKNNVIAKPLSKYGVKVWNFIEWINADASAKLMYAGDNVKSGLITEKQWNSICQWFSNSGLEVEGTRNDWGDYYGFAHEGTGWHAGYKPGLLKNWEYGDYSTFDIADAYLTGSGLNDNDYHKSIADFTGSLMEWVADHGTDPNQYYQRGSFLKGKSCSSRQQNSKYWCYFDVGFRVTLFLN